MDYRFFIKAICVIKDKDCFSRNCNEVTLIENRYEINIKHRLAYKVKK